MKTLRVLIVAARLARTGLTTLLRLVLAARRGPATQRAIIAKELVKLLQQLGPIYVKFGQIASTRLDFFTPEILAELSTLQDAVTPLSFSKITKGRFAEFGFDPRLAFVEIEDKPIASGSIACVYRCTTHEGRRVAVKIRRAEVPRLIAVDVACFSAVARTVGRLPPFRHLPLATTVNSICRTIADQMDFGREMKMIQRFKESLASDRNVAVPEALPQLCGPAIITMELLEPFERSAQHYVVAQQSLADAARNGLAALYRMIFVNGLIHCDLHDGNIRLMRCGSVAVVDFGLVDEMDVEHRLKFSEFFYSVATGNSDNCAAILIETAVSVPNDLQFERFLTDLHSLVQRVGRTPATFSVSLFAIQLFDIQRRHRIVGSPAFFSAIMSLFVYEGTVRRWLPHLNFLREAERYIFLGSFMTGPHRQLVARSI